MALFGRALDQLEIGPGCQPNRLVERRVGRCAGSTAAREADTAMIPPTRRSPRQQSLLRSMPRLQAADSRPGSAERRVGRMAMAGSAAPTPPASANLRRTTEELIKSRPASDAGGSPRCRTFRPRTDRAQGFTLALSPPPPDTFSHGHVQPRSAARRGPRADQHRQDPSRHRAHARPQERDDRVPAAPAWRARTTTASSSCAARARWR